MNFSHSNHEMDTSSEKPLEKNWKYSIALNRWFLVPIGAWPNSLSTTTTEKLLTTALSISSCCLIGFLLIPCGLRTLLDPDTNLDAKVQLIGPLSFFVMAAAKYYFLKSRGDDITGCIRQMRNDWELVESRLEDREIVIDNARFGRSLASFCAAFMYSAGFFYTTVMPLCTKRTEIVNNETVRVPTFPIYRKLFDPRTSPFFEIVQVTQFLAGYVIYSVTISACSLVAVFVMHACGQFRIVMRKLDDLVAGTTNKGDADTADGRLADIVEYHLRILRFISRVEELFTEICFVELIGCTLNICFVGYYFITGWKYYGLMGRVTYMVLLISLTFNIFIFCYVGELLVEECKKVGERSYMIDWYRLPKRKGRALILVIAMSNYSTKLTAGNLIDLSLSSFGDVIKTSVAYLNMLRSLTT